MKRIRVLDLALDTESLVKIPVSYMSLMTLEEGKKELD